jgi:thymidylate synthase
LRLVWTKGHANLVELAALQLRVAWSLGAGVGRLVLRITSAHVYERDLEAVRAILAAAQGPDLAV